MSTHSVNHLYLSGTRHFKGKNTTREKASYARINYSGRARTHFFYSSAACGAVRTTKNETVKAVESDTPTVRVWCRSERTERVVTSSSASVPNAPLLCTNKRLKLLLQLVQASAKVQPPVGRGHRRKRNLEKRRWEKVGPGRG